MLWDSIWVRGSLSKSSFFSPPSHTSHPTPHLHSASWFGLGPRWHSQWAGTLWSQSLEKWDGDGAKNIEGRGWHKRVMPLLTLNNILWFLFLNQSCDWFFGSKPVVCQHPDKEDSPTPSPSLCLFYLLPCSPQCNSLGSMICRLPFPFWLACYLLLKLSPH